LIISFSLSKELFRELEKILWKLFKEKLPIFDEVFGEFSRTSQPI
jgi:hypothetical protein